MMHSKDKLNRTTSIAIVGGGASGISTFVQLIEEIFLNQTETTTPIQIYLIEKPRRLKPGLAYQTQSDSNILNIPYNEGREAAQKLLSIRRHYQRHLFLHQCA